jgi:hypothetical protein
MKKFQVYLIIVISFSACQKDVTTTPNRSGSGNLLTKYVVRDSTNQIINQALFFYDLNSKLSVIKSPNTNRVPPFQKIVLVDSFYRDNLGKTLKHVLRILDSATQLMQPSLFSSTINYVSNTDKVDFVKANQVDDIGNVTYRDSAKFAYSSDGNVKEVNLYIRDSNRYTFFKKYQYNFDTYGNMLEQRIYQPSWNNNGDTTPIHKQKVSQIDNSKKYAHDFAFIDMWLRARKETYMDYQKSMYSKYDETNYNNNGTDPQLYDLIATDNTNNRPDSVAWIPRTQFGVTRLGIKYYYQ